MPPDASSNGIMGAFSISRNSDHILGSSPKQKGAGTCPDPRFPPGYEGESTKIKRADFCISPFYQVGDPYAIRTRECMRERHVS